jgi:putative lipoic acid-binding regulatory protein
MNTITATPGESPLTFPTEFPIKVMGRRVDHFAQEIVRVVRAHAPDFDAATVELRSSSGGNYLSVTATIRATSRAQLDALYRELTSHPLVKVVL